jgi:hypothetical protein
LFDNASITYILGCYKVPAHIMEEVENEHFDSKEYKILVMESAFL